TSGKRTIGQMAQRTSAKVPVPAQVRSTGGDERRGRQAVAGQATGRHAAVAMPDGAESERSTGRQRVVGGGAAGSTAAALPVLAAAGGRGGATAAALPALPARAGDPAARATKGPASATPGQANISSKHGGVPIGGFAKFMLAAAAIETLWGALVIMLSVIELVYGQHPPVIQLVAGWAAFVLIASVIGGQALTRPILRRDVMTRGRRWLQGMLITFYSVAVQAAGVWGVLVFRTQQANPTLAMISYVLFGVSCLIAGIVGIVTVLG
ncbi:MAG: hypothetical protein ACHQ4H_15020, partial [Ktedonobacterales bacterium]